MFVICMCIMCVCIRHRLRCCYIQRSCGAGPSGKLARTALWVADPCPLLLQSDEWAGNHSFYDKYLLDRAFRNNSLSCGTSGNPFQPCAVLVPLCRLFIEELSRDALPPLRRSDPGSIFGGDNGVLARLHRLGEQPRVPTIGLFCQIRMLTQADDYFATRNRGWCMLKALWVLSSQQPHHQRCGRMQPYLCIIVLNFLLQLIIMIILISSNIISSATTATRATSINIHDTHQAVRQGSIVTAMIGEHSG